MPLSSRREVVGTAITAVLIAIFYRYWLVAPALAYLSIGQWRFLAIVAVSAYGGVSALFGLRVLALACGVMAGLLSGGTWAAWRAPSDIPISVGAAFASYLESFWRDVISLTIFATVIAFCCARFGFAKGPR